MGVKYDKRCEIELNKQSSLYRFLNVFEKLKFKRLRERLANKDRSWRFDGNAANKIGLNFHMLTEALRIYPPHGKETDTLHAWGLYIKGCFPE